MCLGNITDVNDTGRGCEQGVVSLEQRIEVKVGRKRIGIGFWDKVFYARNERAVYPRRGY